MSGFDDYRDLCEERDQLRAELEAAKQDAAKCAAAHINAVSACNENAHLLTKASAELAELRARVSNSVDGDDIEWPAYHTQGMGCGIEDRGITDRYEACQYGFQEAVDQCAQAFDNWLAHARPVPPAAVPDDVAKYRHHLELLRDDCTYPAGHVGAVVLNGHRMEIIRDALAAFLAKIDAAKGGGSEVVAYRIHWPQPEPLKTTYEVTDDGKRYEEVKALNHCRIDWLGVVGGIDRALAASGRQDGAR